MRKIILLFSLATLLILPSCDKKDSPGDNYDFTNSLPAYVTLSSTAAKTVAQGGSTTVTFQMRTALQQAVTVTYSVSGGGVDLPNQVATIDRDKTSIVATINIPNNVIVPPATTATTVLTLVKATAADGTELTIGSKNNAAAQVVTINITL